LRHYLVDGSNVVRRGNYDPRFPEMEEVRTEDFLFRIDEMASACSGEIRIEIFFDGPVRAHLPVDSPVHVRFPIDGYADDAIIGTARQLINRGKGAVIVTGDGRLAKSLQAEGARIMSPSEFETRLREDRA